MPSYLADHGTKMVALVLDPFCSCAMLMHCHGECTVQCFGFFTDPDPDPGFLSLDLDPI